MIGATAIVSLAVFAGALWLLGVTRVAAGALTTAQAAVKIMRDGQLDDLAREKAVQRASLSLFGIVGSILIRSLLAIAASLAPVWLANRAGLATPAQVFDFLSRWDVMLAATAVMVAGYITWERLWPSSRITHP